MLNRDVWAARVESGDWNAITREIDEFGGALLPWLLTPDEATEIRAMYDDATDVFRTTIDMARHRFGSGRYRYFNAPYPAPIEELKKALYPRLLTIARDWWGKLGRSAPWPDTLDEWLALCHRGRSDQVDGAAAQVRRGGLERASPGPLWGPDLPVAGGDQPQ